MKTILSTLLSASLSVAAFAQVPGLINYQGRLTAANGSPVTSSKSFAIGIYDAATDGNLLYSESIGAVTLDSNGVYSFQFGHSGTSNSQVTETIGTTAGSTLTYTKTLSSTPVVANSITVTDGTNSWSQSVGNPGVAATATASRASGFVIGAEITNGGSGYTSAPLVTITGSGSGATATATLTGGVVTEITINSAGSGYSGGATITIAPPVIPFRVDYSGGAITATYSTAPAAGRTITATYRYSTSGITGALSSGAEHWMALSVDGTAQTTRQRVLAVPFAVKAARAETAAIADSATVAQVAIKADTLSPQSKNWRPHPLFQGNSRITLPVELSTVPGIAYIPNSIKSLNSVKIRGYIPPINTTYGREGVLSIVIIKTTLIYAPNTRYETTSTTVWSHERRNVGDFDLSLPVNLSVDENSTYTISITGGSEGTRYHDILFSITE
jgi:hypothetical protein